MTTSSTSHDTKKSPLERNWICLMTLQSLQDTLVILCSLNHFKWLESYSFQCNKKTLLVLPADCITSDWGPTRRPSLPHYQITKIHFSLCFIPLHATNLKWNNLSQIKLMSVPSENYAHIWHFVDSCCVVQYEWILSISFRVISANF